MPTPTTDPVARLIQAHVVGELRSYSGNLASVLQAVRENWVPAEDAPEIEQHVRTLSDHMTEVGHPRDDAFLLRVGLTVPGMQRGIVPPLMVLQPNRGGFSARRRGEAEGIIRCLSEALEIGRQFVPDLSADTQQALVELANICEVQPRQPSDAQWFRWFQALSSGQAEDLAKRAIECLDTQTKPVVEVGREILKHLACFRHPPLSEACCSALIERGVYWPGSLYQDAGNAVAAQLLERIEAGRVSELNHLLLALGWTRSDAAREAFCHWTMHPPGWVSKLYVPPAEYLHDAGWCLEEDGKPRELISNRCIRLVPAARMEKHRIRCRSRTGERCRACTGPLSWLFDFSRLGGDYFRGEIAGAPRRILCCLHCACFGPVFTRYQADGESEWLGATAPCEFEYAGAAESCVRKVEDSPCPPFACAEALALEDSSTLGGIPMWLQDAEFPRCIECNRLMTFFAQHDNGPLGDEGIYYAFFCDRCHVAAVTYQQT